MTHYRKGDLFTTTVKGFLFSYTIEGFCWHTVNKVHLAPEEKVLLKAYTKLFGTISFILQRNISILNTLAGIAANGSVGLNIINKRLADINQVKQL